MPKLAKAVICTVLVAILNSHLPSECPMHLILAQKGYPSYTERTVSLNFCKKMHLEKRDEDMTRVWYIFVMSFLTLKIRCVLW
jgi:hypothetical protein